MHQRVFVLCRALGLILVCQFLMPAATSSFSSAGAQPGSAAKEPPRDWVVYATEIGWLRVGRLAESAAPWKKRDEIWGGISEEPLEKVLLRKGYGSREEALEALCARLTRVQLNIRPPTQGAPARYLSGVLDGQEYNLRLTPGFSADAVEAMSRGGFWKGLEYDWRAEWDTLARYHITPRQVFGKQWLVHSIEHGTREGPRREDRWMCAPYPPVADKAGRLFLTLPDGYGGWIIHQVREVEGPFRDNYTLAQVLRRHGVPQVDLWPPRTSVMGLDVQPRVAAAEVPGRPKDYGDGTVPQQAVLPDQVLQDWVIYAVEGGWLHVGTRYEFGRPLLKREVIFGGLAADPARKTLLAPAGEAKFHSRSQALRFLLSRLANVTTQFNATANPREVIVGTFQGAEYRLRFDRGRGGDDVAEYKSLDYGHDEIWNALVQNRIAPLRRFGPLKLIHSIGHGTISGPVKDDMWVLVSANSVAPDGRSMLLPDGMGGYFGYTLDFAQPATGMTTNYEISPMLQALIARNPGLETKLASVALWGISRGVTAAEVPPGCTNQGAAVAPSRIRLVNVLPQEIEQGAKLAILIRAEGMEPGCALDFGPGIQATDLAYGGRDADGRSDQWHCTLEIAADAPPGPRNLLATNPDGGSGSVSGPAVVEPKDSEVQLPPLPLILPAAELEGLLRNELASLKESIDRELQAAKALGARKTAPPPGTRVDSLDYLIRWATSKQDRLASERDARQHAEQFFRILAASYDRMTPAERNSVEQGLSSRAFALRAYRTVQRRILRERSGLGSARTHQALDEYHTALYRANWAALEMDALCRMWSTMAHARLFYHKSYNAYDGAEILPDPSRPAATELSRRAHFEALIDLGLASLLASESSYEAMMEARKDRLYGMKEWWQDARHAWNDPMASRGFAGAAIQLFSFGFNVFDLVAGMGADAVKGGIYYVFGADFHTRAEKLEDRVMENWEKTQRKILVLRLLRLRTLADVRAMAEDAAKGVPASSLPIAGDKIDAEDIKLVMEDRALHEATDGGLFRMLSIALVSYRSRCSLELRIAAEMIGLLQRDERSAYRQEQGQDPETGETTWGTILSPMAWTELASKNIFHRTDYSQRSAHIAAKDRQMAMCDRLGDALPEIDFAFEKLPPDLLLEHTRLLASSAPYVSFCIRVREEDAARTLSRMNRAIRNLEGDPLTAARAAFLQELLLDSVSMERKAESRRMLDLLYEEFVYAWDLSGALSIAEGLKQDPVYAARLQLLKDAVATDRVKTRGIQLFRNLGDMGLTMAASGLASRVMITVNSEGIVLSLAEAVQTGQTSFARYLFGVLNPIVLGPQELIEEVLTEVATDIGTSIAGPEYEELIGKVMDQVVEYLSGRLFPDEMPFQPDVQEQMRRFEQTLAARMQQEERRFADLDPTLFSNTVRRRQVPLTVAAIRSELQKAEQAPSRQIRESIQRRNINTWSDGSRLLQSSVLAQCYQKARQALVRQVDADTARIYAQARALAVQRARPPSVEIYQEIVQTRPQDLFAPKSGRDVQSMRADFKFLMAALPVTEHARLDSVLAAIDLVRDQKVRRALARVLAAHAADIRGIVVNGTARGNPEYKGLFSDNDYTLVLRNAAAEPRVRDAVNDAFRAEGIIPTSAQNPGTADVEVMIQEFLPGQSVPLQTVDALLRWATGTSRNAATRYLSAGGAMWVGLYNHLNGGTLSYQDGNVLPDAAGNPDLLPKPVMHPLFAHGLVLDMARFDKLIDPAGLSAADLAEMAGARAKFVLRAADALIWAHAPELMNHRTPETARRLGYHALIVADARVLAQRGQLTAGEFRLIQMLADIKRGLSAANALGIDPRNLEQQREQLVDFWNGMTGLMQKAYGVTREKQLSLMESIAQRSIDNPVRREQLFELAFQNWSAAEKIPPNSLQMLTGQVAQVALRGMRQQEQFIISQGVEIKQPVQPASPLPIPEPASVPPGDPGDVRPAEGTAPAQRSTPESVSVLPAAPDAEKDYLRPFGEQLRSEAMQKLSATASDFYSSQFKDPVGFVKSALSDAPYELPNEVAAYEFGRLLNANVPYTEIIPVEGGQQQIALMRFVPGVNLADILSDPARLPAGLTLPDFLARSKPQFILDVILSALLGDFDRRPPNYMVTPGATLVPVDHAAAEPIESGLGVDPNVNRGLVLEAMRERFRERRFRDLVARMGVTYEEVAAAWQAEQAKLTTGQLQRIAALYGPQDGPRAVATWRIRKEVFLEAAEGTFPQAR